MPFVRKSTSLLLLVTVTAVSCAHGKEIDFNRDIRPLLAEHCLHCHGPDSGTREAELRLDREAAAKESAVVPGKPQESELVLRVQSQDPDSIMPPPDSGKALEPHEIALLTDWVRQGAPWDQHWSFKPISRPAVPELRSDWIRNPIDSFVLSRLQSLPP